MDFKNMVIKCIQEDCLKLTDLKSACSVFDRYGRLSDLDIILIYDEYFGLDKNNENDFLC